MSGESFIVKQTDSRTNKSGEYCRRILCNEAFKRILNCNSPLAALSRAFRVDVRHTSFAVLFYIVIARLDILRKDKPQAPEFTEFLKSKHFLPPCTCALCPAMLRLDVYQ